MRGLATYLLAALALFGPAAGCGPAQEARWERPAGVRTHRPDARVQIKGLACPYCVYNVERSLLHVEGVRRVRTDLNRGVATIWFDADHHPTPQAIWKAVQKSGFTPVRVVIGDETYERS